MFVCAVLVSSFICFRFTPGCAQGSLLVAIQEPYTVLRLKPLGSAVYKSPNSFMFPLLLVHCTDFLWLLPQMTPLGGLKLHRFILSWNLSQQVWAPSGGFGGPSVPVPLFRFLSHHVPGMVHALLSCPQSQHCSIFNSSSFPVKLPA